MKEKQAPQFVHDFSKNYPTIEKRREKLKTHTTDHLNKALGLLKGHEDASSKLVDELIRDELKVRTTKEETMFSKVFKANPKGINQYTKGSAESHADAFKKGVAAGKKGGFSSDSPYPKTDSEHEHWLGGLDEGRSQSSKRKAKKNENPVSGWAGDLGLRK